MNRRATAYHEAGHCIAQMRTGLRVERVTTEPTERQEGYSYASAADSEPLSQAQVVAFAAIDPEHPSLAGFALPEPPTGDEAERELLRLLAGTVAEEIATGERNDTAAASDLRKARRILRASERPFLDWMWDLFQARRRTRAFLEEHWRDVETIAAALQKHGTLTGDHVRELLEKRPARRTARALVGDAPATLGMPYRSAYA